MPTGIICKKDGQTIFNQQLHTYVFSTTATLAQHLTFQILSSFVLVHQRDGPSKPGPRSPCGRPNATYTSASCHLGSD